MIIEHDDGKLPVDDETKINLSKDEDNIYELLIKYGELSRNEIDELTGFNKSKTIRNLNKLLSINVIIKIGSGTNIKYRINKHIK